MRAAKNKTEHTRDSAQEGAIDFGIGKRLFGRMKSTSSGTTMLIPKQEHAFAQWLAERMPDLLNEYTHRDGSPV
jgi:ParB family chromosome partitioning protein